jgi:hypothetical protein
VDTAGGRLNSALAFLPQPLSGTSKSKRQTTDAAPLARIQYLDRLKSQPPVT